MSTTTVVAAQQRKSWHKRLGKYFKKITIGNSRPARGRQSRRYEGDFHYVISAEQEDEIRESFLVDKLRPYTQTLSESDIEGKQDADEEKPIDNSDDDVCTGLICVPVSGQCRADYLTEVEEPSNRKIPNGCAICLCPFQAEDRVSWSSNKECSHVFHEACILDWLNTSGRRHLHRRRRDDQREGVLNYANDPLRKITRFPMPCPCCRQLFVVCPEAEELKEAVVTSTSTSSTSDESVEENSSAGAHQDEEEQLTETSQETELNPSHITINRPGNLTEPAVNTAVMNMEVSA